MAQTEIGKLITGDAERDAIHIAVAPVIAARPLLPGDPIGLLEDGTVSRREPHIGIVDPFLQNHVLAGQRFYLVKFMPNPSTPDLLRAASPRTKALGTFGNPSITPAELSKLAKAKRGPGPEAGVTEKCVGLLESHGWRAIRMNRGIARYGDRGVVTYGEPGVPDWLFVRYALRPMDGSTRILWIEFKSPTDKRKCTCRTKRPRTRCGVCDQQNWRVREQARGAVVLRISSLEELMAMEVWK